MSDAARERVTIRSARAEDAAALATLAAELSAWEGEEARGTAESLRRDVLARPGWARMLVAETEGKPVGFLLFYPGYDLESASFGFHLADLLVTAAARGRGIGTRLMREAARQVRAEGGAWLSWTVLEKNSTALEFYAALGAREQGVRFLALGAEGLRSLAEGN
jgi:ribosomal protein S18 acetylase RimI-like enzyme